MEPVDATAGMVAVIAAGKAARAMPTCANIAAARTGAAPEIADSATGGELRFSLGRRELARMRMARPSATNATTNP
jgi:hypothetical protein